MSIPYIDLKKKAVNYTKIGKLLESYTNSTGWETEAYNNYIDFLGESNDNSASLNQFLEIHKKLISFDQVGYKPSILYSGVVTSTISSKGEPDIVNFFHAFSIIECVHPVENHKQYLTVSHQDNGRYIFEFISYKMS